MFTVLSKTLLLFSKGFDFRGQCQGFMQVLIHFLWLFWMHPSLMGEKESSHKVM